MSKRVLCFGDSNTWGYDPDNQPEDGSYFVRYPSEVRWTGVLQKLLGEGYTVIEEGLGGRTSVWDDPFVPYRNGLKYIDACLATHAPLDLVVIMIGTNDLKPRISGRAFEIAEGVGVLVEHAQTSTAGRDGKAPAVLMVSPIAIGREIEELSLADELGGLAAYEEALKFPHYFSAKAEAMGCHYMDAARHAVPKVDAIHLDAENHGKLATALCGRIKEII